MQQNLDSTHRADNSPLLELGMQELEAMEAPSFWSGFKQGLVISAIAVAGATLAT